MLLLLVLLLLLVVLLLLLLLLLCALYLVWLHAGVCKRGSEASSCCQSRPLAPTQ